MKDVQQGQALKVRKTLDYGYACTVHKSQGGTYNKIMYYADTVAPFDKKVQNQLDYVAVSRAKENVYIVTNHEIKEQMSKDTTTETNDQNDAILTHKDKYGKEQDNGRFSRLLTEIREEFRNEPQSQKYTGNLLEQADFSEFNEMREEGKKIADICKNK